METFIANRVTINVEGRVDTRRTVNMSPSDDAITLPTLDGGEMLVEFITDKLIYVSWTEEEMVAFVVTDPKGDIITKSKVTMENAKFLMFCTCNEPGGVCCKLGDWRDDLEWNGIAHVKGDDGNHYTAFTVKAD